MSEQNKKTLYTYAAPMFLAMVVRVMLYASWLDSPFRLYHTLVGLDMRKFLDWGIGLANGHCRFTMYRFLVAILNFLAGSANLAEHVVIAQLILGVATTGLTVYIFRNLFHNRSAAIFAGAIFALYAPPMLYETQILKETLYLFLTTLSLATLIRAVASRGAAKKSVACGVFAILPFLVRFSGILWFVNVCVWMSLTQFKRKRSAWKAPATVLAGAASVLAVIFAYELFHGRSPTPFFSPNAAYVLQVGAKPKLNDLSLPTSTPTNNAEPSNIHTNANGSNSITFFSRYIAKTPYIITSAEMPNNVNLYFARSRLFPLGVAIQPGLLVPFGLAGLILIIIRPASRGRATPLLLMILSFAVPMILFVPLARYKLILAPTLCVSTAFLAMTVIREIRGKNWSAFAVASGIVAATFAVSASFAPLPHVRYSDIKAYGMTAVKEPVRLMISGKFREANVILASLAADNPKNPYIQLEYASTLLGTGTPKKALAYLREMDPPSERHLAARRFFEIAEANRILGHKNTAKQHYNQSLRLGISGFREKIARRNAKIQ